MKTESDTVETATSADDSHGPQRRLPRTVPLAIVFLDIVGYSKRPDKLQLSFVEILQGAVRHSSFFRSSQPRRPPWRDVVILPTGDGMAVCCYCECVFEHPLLLLDFSVSVLEFCEASGFELRIGIHVGDGQLYEDINGRTNVAGTGINRAQRVMSLGEPSQILVSAAFRELVAAKLGEEKATTLFEDHGSALAKHGLVLGIYSYAPPCCRLGWTKRPHRIQRQALVESHLHWQLGEIEKKLRAFFWSEFELKAVDLALRISLLHRAPNPTNKLQDGLLVSSIRYCEEQHLLNDAPSRLWFSENEGPGRALGYELDSRATPPALVISDLPKVDRGKDSPDAIEQYYKELETRCGTPRAKAERLHRLAASFIYVPFGMGRPGDKWDGVIAIDSKNPLKGLVTPVEEENVQLKVRAMADAISKEWEIVGYAWTLFSQ